MRYWAYFVAKAGAVVGVLWVVLRLLQFSFPRKSTFLNSQQDAFGHDLNYTTAMMLYFLLGFGLFYVIVWDQRYRCRTCVRRLRMPVAAGSWPNMFLIGQPRMEYICIYGHGTLKVPEVELTGSKSPNWEPHDDIWKELETIEAGKR
jgi:hypothetical protein